MTVSGRSTARSGARRARRGPLGLSLSSGVLGAVGVGLPCLIVAGAAAGWRGLASALAGLVVVLLFFGLSLYLVEVADRVAPAMTLPVGITVYGVLTLWLGILAFGTSLPDRIHRSAFAWTVIAATIGWVLVQAAAVWRQRMAYVDVPLPGDAPADTPGDTPRSRGPVRR